MTEATGDGAGEAILKIDETGDGAGEALLMTDESGDRAEAILLIDKTRAEEGRLTWNDFSPSSRLLLLPGLPRYVKLTKPLLR